MRPLAQASLAQEPLAQVSLGPEMQTQFRSGCAGASGSARVDAIPRAPPNALSFLRYLLCSGTSSAAHPCHWWLPAGPTDPGFALHASAVDSARLGRMVKQTAGGMTKTIAGTSNILGLNMHPPSPR